MKRVDVSVKVGLSVFLVVSVFFVLPVSFVFATPPGSAYNPGETVSPGCIVGATNCTVKPYAVSGVNADITSLTGLTTPLTVAQGGTGTTSLTANGILLGNGTSGFQTATSGSAYQVFRTPSSGGIPSFGAIDLSQSASVTGILSITNGGVGTTTAPSYGQILVGNSAGGYTYFATSSLGLLSSIGGSDTQVQFNNAGSLGGNAALLFNSTAGRLTSTYASTTGISSSYASSTNLFTGSLSVGALSGFLKATSGGVAASLINLASDITGTLPIIGGGTGSASVPSYGQILVGNNAGGYTLTATTSLGLSVGSIGGSDTQVQYNNAGSFAGNAALLFNSTAGRLTSTYASTTGISSSYASSTNLFSGVLSTGSLSVGSLSGFLKATAGSVATSLISLASDVTGLLPVTNGGTGTTSALTTGSIVFATTSGAFSENNSKLFWTDSSSRLSVVGTLAGTHLKGLGSAPSVAAGTGAGSSPTVSVSGTDTAGEITVTTGTLPTLSGTVITLTFATAYSSAPYISMVPANAATAILSGATMVFPTISASAVTLTAGLTALTGATIYKWHYMVIE